MEDTGARRPRSRGTSLITVIGNLGGDPEMRYTQTGVPFTSFRVAVNNIRRGPDGQDVEHTDWFRVTAWRGLAETANNILQRGGQVFVQGRFRTSTWENREGQTQTSLEITANEIQALSRGRDRGEAGAPSEPAGAPAEAELDPDDLPF